MQEVCAYLVHAAVAGREDYWPKAALGQRWVGDWPVAAGRIAGKRENIENGEAPASRRLSVDAMCGDKSAFAFSKVEFAQA